MNFNFHLTRKQVIDSLCSLLENLLIFFFAWLVLSYTYDFTLKYLFKLLIDINDSLNLNFLIPFPTAEENPYLSLFMYCFYFLLVFIFIRPYKSFVLFKRFLDNKYFLFFFAYCIGRSSQIYIEDSSLDTIKKALIGTLEFTEDYHNTFSLAMEKVTEFGAYVVGSSTRIFLDNLILIGILVGSAYYLNKAILKLNNSNLQDKKSN